MLSANTYRFHIVTDQYLIKTGLEKSINLSFKDTHIHIIHSKTLDDYFNIEQEENGFSIFCINPSLKNIDEQVERLQGMPNKDKRQAVIVNMADHLGNAKIIVNLSWGGIFSLFDDQYNIINQFQNLVNGKQSVSATIKSQFFEGNFRNSGEEKNNVNKLSKRQLQIVKLVADGLSARDIAHQLSISINTVQNHKSQILQITEANNSSHLISMCCKAGVLDYDN